MKKFRAWNGEEMISPDYIDRNGTAWWKENSIPTFSDKVMLSTNKHDKWAQEIFEGDKLKDIDGEYLLVFWNEQECKMQIDLYDYKMYFNEGGGEEYENTISCVDKDCVNISDLSDYEIIGHIYQPQ